MPAGRLELTGTGFDEFGLLSHTCISPPSSVQNIVDSCERSNGRSAIPPLPLNSAQPVWPPPGELRPSARCE